MVGAARGFGVRRLSLNFAVLRSVFSGAEQLGSGPVLRLTAAVLTFASRWWQLETLYRSNVKYRPRWDPRFICFQTGFAVNRGVIAAGVAEGFIPGPAPAGYRLRADDELAAAVRAIDAAPPAWTALTRTPRGQALVRHRKLEVLAANGVAAYPVRVPRTTSVADVRKHHGGLGPGAATGEVVSVVGRIVRLRDHGGLRFAVHPRGRRRRPGHGGARRPRPGGGRPVGRHRRSRRPGERDRRGGHQPHAVSCRCRRRRGRWRRSACGRCPSIGRAPAWPPIATSS